MPGRRIDQLLNPGESKSDLRIEKAQRRKANKQKKAKKKYAKGSVQDVVSAPEGSLSDEI
ncbi:hypothetical protein QFC19_000762 [Naganishia cerealis]|uniref:Uncharacterized protein n=1 Tax=Naganishia cerealis TaxID=610337 RepID=A0ACC2WL28_9TREE|nr:hypothetical protein QFC19_000762 [Naganishia cerealis]